MSIFDKLEKIQNKPEHIRKRILTVSVVLIMILIIFLWINDLKYSLQNKESESPPGPFSVFKEAILSSVSTLRAEIK